MIKKFIVEGKELKSRLFLGTGKFSSASALRDAIDASGSELVTVALRRVDLNSSQDDIMSAIDRSRVGRNAQHQRRPANGRRSDPDCPGSAARAGFNCIKLENSSRPPIICCPDPIETFEAAMVLVKGTGSRYCRISTADPVLAKTAGRDRRPPRVMPLGAPIGHCNQGTQKPKQCCGSSSNSRTCR